MSIHTSSKPTETYGAFSIGGEEFIVNKTMEGRSKGGIKGVEWFGDNVVRVLNELCKERSIVRLSFGSM